MQCHCTSKDAFIKSKQRGKEDWYTIGSTNWLNHGSRDLTVSKEKLDMRMLVTYYFDKDAICY